MTAESSAEAAPMLGFGEVHVLGAGQTYPVEKPSSAEPGWYPMVCAWMQEGRPGILAEDGLMATWEMLEPIIRRKLVDARVAFFDSDVDSCRDEAFRRIEEKLLRQEYPIALAPVRSPELEELKTHVKLPGVRQVGFRFEISTPDLITHGYKIRLRSAGAVEWEEDGVVEQFDSLNGKVLVSVSANRLRHGTIYGLGLYSPGAQSAFACEEFWVVQVEALHLLRSGPFTIVGRHPSFRAAQRYSAQICDMDDGTELGIVSVMCESDGHLALQLQYDLLRNEQNARVEISPEGSRGERYFCCVRAVRHEDWKGRRGYANQMARNVAGEHARKLSRHPHTSLAEDFANRLGTSHDIERQRIADILSQRAVDQARTLVKRLPIALQKQMKEHYIEGSSWAEIAGRYGITKDKAKQDSHRAFEEISEAIASEPNANHRAVIKWLKETLSNILEL
jgi:DNA-directed RNA polymerase specialized sigma24 family protein